jgi:hypothetical protein
MKKLNAEIERIIFAFLDNYTGFILATFLSSIVGLVLVFVMSLIKSSNDPTFSLKKQEWKCTSTFERKQFTGKIWVTVTDCAQWSRDEK